MNKSAMSSADNQRPKQGLRRFLSISKWLVIAIAIVLAAIGIRSFFFNPLPSDEEFIGYFQAHRTDIEELVRRYRAYEPPSGQGHHLWEQQGDTPLLLKRAGLWTVDYVGADWFPDPYSPDAAKRRQALFDQFGEAIRYKYGTIGIRYADRRYWLNVSLRYGNTMWKNLWFFPEVPRIENGWLIAPPGRHGSFGPNFKVLSSLNDYPPDWKKGDCVLRQIESQWFIQMCRV